MARIPFSAMPPKQRVAIILSLQKRGLWVFKPIEKLRNFNRWVREFEGRKIPRSGIQSLDVSRQNDLLSLRGKGPINSRTLESLDDYFHQWVMEGPRTPYARPMIRATASGIKNPQMFGFTGSMTSSLNAVEALTRYRALNRALLKKRFPGGKVTLYRGLIGDQAKLYQTAGRKRGTVDHRFLTSYSEDPEIASAWSHPDGIVLKTVLPIERSAYSWRLLGVPYNTVKEHLIFGGKIPVQIALKVGGKGDAPYPIF